MCQFDISFALTSTHVDKYFEVKKTWHLFKRNNKNLCYNVDNASLFCVKVLEERRKFREEEERVKQLMTPVPPPPPPAPADIKIDVAQLKTLAELGIETNFLDTIGD